MEPYFANIKKRICFFCVTAKSYKQKYFHATKRTNLDIWGRIGRDAARTFVLLPPVQCTSPWASAWQSACSRIYRPGHLCWVTLAPLYAFILHRVNVDQMSVLTPFQPFPPKSSLFADIPQIGLWDTLLFGEPPFLGADWIVLKNSALV